MDLVQPAVAWVRTDWTAWVLTNVRARPIIRTDMVGLCSGFVVGPGGYLLTAGHCVDNGEAKDLAVRLAVDQLVRAGLLPAANREALITRVQAGLVRWTVEGQAADSPPDRLVHVRLGGGKVQWQEDMRRFGGVPARVLDIRPYKEGDIALLKVERENLATVQLSEDPVQVGEQVLSIGYPMELANREDGQPTAVTARNGQINSTDMERASGSLFYETSTAVSGGQSGGPAVDLRGRVVGLISWRAGDQTASYIVPASRLREVMTRNGVNSTPSQVDTLYRSALDSYYHGYYTEAIQGFDRVLGITPDSEAAKARKEKAADLRQQYGDQAKTAPRTGDRSLLGPSSLVVTIILVTVLILGTTVVWLRRRRTQSEASGAQTSLGPSIPTERASDEDVPRPESEPIDILGVSGSTDAGRDFAPRSPWPTEMAEMPTNGLRTARSGFNDQEAGIGEAGDQPEAAEETSSVLTVTTGSGGDSTCAQCGAVNGHDAVFCSHCGTRLGL